MEGLYRRFFDALPINHGVADEHLHLLNEGERELVRRTERWALTAAVLVELVAYLWIFLPVYAAPEVFEARTLDLGGPFVDEGGTVPWVRSLWMLTVTLFELYVLLLINLAAVHGIAAATGYIRRHDRSDQAAGLISIALERRSTDQREFGIDPFEGLHPWVLYLFLLLNRFKGLIGSILVRAALVNLFGREILRVYLDFSGMPIYMAINYYTTYVILRNARVVVMGEAAIEVIREQLPVLRLTEPERDLIYDTLQYIAVNKRDYHANHFFLTKALIEHFGISVKSRHPLPGDFLEKLKATRPEVAAVCRLAIVIGFLLDGRISWRERRQIAELRQRGVLDVDYEALEGFRRSFVEGQGLDGVAMRFLSMG